MTANEKIAKIVETIESGYTVSFTTRLRSYPVNLRTLDKFRKAGYELFKARGNSIYMLNGKRYICMDGCNVTFE